MILEGVTRPKKTTDPLTKEGQQPPGLKVPRDFALPNETTEQSAANRL